MTRIEYIPPKTMSLRQRIRVAWAILWNHSVYYTVEDRPGKVSCQIEGLLQDLESHVKED